jgi:quinol monooxygenase YgiN
MSSTSIAMALYRPHPGKEEELREILQSHIPTLRAEGLITKREPIIMQAEDGTIIEIFEWQSREAKDKAHNSPNVMSIWNKISSVAEVVSLSTLKEAERPFPNFNPL